MFPTLLHWYDKETENKHRYSLMCDGTPFHLYIPKKSLPSEIPHFLEVMVLDPRDPHVCQLVSAYRASAACIVTTVTFVSDHTKTRRYKPEGDPADWEIGEPYIPTEYTFDESSTLTVVVRWL